MAGKKTASIVRVVLSQSGLKKSSSRPARFSWSPRVTPYDKLQHLYTRLSQIYLQDKPVPIGSTSSSLFLPLWQNCFEALPHTIYFTAKGDGGE